MTPLTLTTSLAPIALIFADTSLGTDACVLAAPTGMSAVTTLLAFAACLATCLVDESSPTGAR
jgi:hypothetical protein